MLIISLNTCHHLTHQAVALLTDSIHAKKKKKSKARLSSFSIIHPFFPLLHPLSASSFRTSCVCCHLLSSCLPPMLFFSSNSSYCTVTLVHRLDGWIGFRPCPLPSSSSRGSVKLERETRGGGGGILQQQSEVNVTRLKIYDACGALQGGG